MTATPQTPLPSRALLGPYRVEVRLVLPATIARLLRRRHEDGEAAGCWDPGRVAIYIDRTLSRPRQWEVYWHEIAHAVADLAARQKGGL